MRISSQDLAQFLEGEATERGRGLQWIDVHGAAGLLPSSDRGGDGRNWDVFNPDILC